MPVRKKSISTGKIVKPTKSEVDYLGMGGIVRTGSSLPAKTAGDWAGMEGESKQLGYYKPRWTSPLLSWTNYYIPWDRATLMQWCFAPGTKVWMQDGGVKNIEEIEANDVVLNGEGGLGKVIETISHHHSGDIYKIWTWGSSEPIICSEEHPLLSVLRDDATCSFRDKTDQARFNGKFIGKKCYFGSVDICRDNKCLTCNYNPEYREAGNLKVGDYLVTNPFGGSVTAEIPIARSIIAGFYAAEGWIEKSGRVSIANTNPDFINKLETALIALGVEYNVNAGKDGVFRVFTFDKNLRSYLEENVGCGASEKRVPSDVVHSIEHGKEFIKAYMAGDGHTPDEGEARYFTVSEQLAWQLKALFETCGCPVSLVKIEKFDAGHYGKKPIFRGRIQWSDWQNKILGGEVRGFGRARRTFYDESKKAILRKIKKIEIENYDGMLYNLEVEDSHTYTANGFSVHNCRFYDTFHPLVGNAMDLHTQMPLSRFVLKGIKDKKVLRFFEQTLEQMDAFMLMYSQLREYWLIGENFTYLNWDEDMGTFTDGELLMPEYIEVRGHPFVRGETEGSYAYFLIPDEGIRAFINSPDESCQELKGKVPMEIRQAVEEEKNIRISNFNLMVLMRKQARYNPRGTSIILRCLKDLLYEDKLREAQYAIADRHVLPKEIWKIGNEKFLPNKTKMKAFRNLIRDAEDQPKFTLVTHYAVNYEIQGATGKFPQLTTEFEWVENRILTALFCYDENTEVLTDKGFKFYDDVGDDELIATVNKETGALEYQKPTLRRKWDYDGDMYHFVNNKMDICVTPNHRMLTVAPGMVTRNEKSYVAKMDKTYDTVRHHLEAPKMTDFETWKWQVLAADKVQKSSRFRGVVDSWTGTDMETVKVGERDIDIDTYLKLAAWYISEGWIAYNHNNKTGERTTPQAVCVSQKKYKEHVTALWKTLPFATSIRKYNEFTVRDKEVAANFEATFKTLSHSKELPGWLVNLPPARLQLFLNELVMGDGSCTDGGRMNRVYDTKYYRYSTMSKKLADQIQEIAFKCGHAPKLSQYKSGIYTILWATSEFGKFPTVVKEPIVEKYDSYVWCFEVPNHFFVTRRNGFIAIQGNTNKALTHGEGPTYANASIATRAMMMRYIPVRSQLEEVWKSKVFLPIAIEHGFYKVSEADLSHKVRTRKTDRELTVPEFDWRWKSNLLDDQSVRDMVKGMVGDGKLPMKTLIDMLGMDYDSIVEWRKKEEGTVFDPLYEELRKAAQKEGMELSKGASTSKPAIERRLTEMRTATKQLLKKEAKIPKPREFDFLSRGGLNRKIKAASMLLHKGEADVVKFLLGTGKDNIVTLTSKTNEKDAQKYIENMKRDRNDSL